MELTFFLLFFALFWFPAGTRCCAVSPEGITGTSSCHKFWCPPWISHVQKISCMSLSLLGTLQLLKRSAVGLSLQSLESCGQSWDHQREDKLRWQCSYRPERLLCWSFLSPYLLVYYSNLKLQGPITLKGVMQPLYGSLVAGRGKAAAIDLWKGIHRITFTCVAHSLPRSASISFLKWPVL